MAALESGNNNGATAIVDSVSRALRVTAYDSGGNELTVTENSQPAAVGGFAMMGQNDRSVLPARMDRLGSLTSSLHTPYLVDSFEGNTINPLRWNIISTTMTASQTSNGGLIINSTNITTINTGYFLQSTKRFLKVQRSPIQFKFRARLNAVNNSVMELGFGDAATFNGANTNGAYWQVTSSGAVIPVLTFNGSDLTGTDIRSLINITNYYTFDIIIDDDEAVYIIQDTSSGLIISKQSIRLPVTGTRLWSATQLGVIARLYITGTAPVNAPNLILTDSMVLGLDIQTNKPWSHTLATLDRGFLSNPFTGAQAPQWVNSLEPANAGLSNTAASYATLGGKFQLAAPTGALTDYALFGYVVPAPSNFVITGVDIEVWNTVVASATTSTLLTWAIGVGSTAVSLATAGIVRTGLGAQTIPIGTAPGTSVPRLSKTFTTPIHCPAGRFIHIILRIPVGTATATQVIAGMVNIEGYSE